MEIKTAPIDDFKSFVRKTDVIAMSLVYYSRDIGVKSLALYLIE